MTRATNDQKTMRVNGARMRMLREKRGYTQGQLAAHSGVSQGHISNMERGHTPTSLSDTLLRLAKKLRTNVSYLVGDSDDPRPTDDYLSQDFVTSSWHPLGRRV